MLAFFEEATFAKKNSYVKHHFPDEKDLDVMLVVCFPCSSGTLENLSLYSETLRVLERNRQGRCRKHSMG